MKKLAFILLCSSALLVASPQSQAQISVGVGISVRLAPPAIPVYTQPECPVDGYLWQPGYWAYGDDGYYWVPGVWVAPPDPGLLWTPGYWGYGDSGVYLFHAGYWGPHVGFYGGINYGFGYFGSGFGGGVWVGRSFRYNTAVFRVNSRVVHNTYVNRTVINRTTINNHTSFNGGPRGTHAAPSSQERNYMNERHVQPTGEQMQHQQSAAQNRGLRSSVNHGRPQVAAVSRPGTAFGGGNHAAAAANRPTSQRSFSARSPQQPVSHQGFGGNHAAPHQQMARPAPQQHQQAPQQHQQAPQQHQQAPPQQRQQAPQQRQAPAQHFGGGGARPMGGGGGRPMGGGGGHPGGGGRRH